MTGFVIAFKNPENGILKFTYWTWTVIMSEFKLTIVMVVVVVKME